MSECSNKDEELDEGLPSFSVSPDTLIGCASGTISIASSSASPLPGIPDFRVSLGMDVYPSNNGNGTEYELNATPPCDSLCLSEETDRIERSLYEILGDSTVPSPPPDMEDPIDEEKPSSTKETLPSISFEEDE